MLEKLRLRRFCCCCTLKTGSYVIAFLGWFGTLSYGVSYQKGSTGETATISLFALCMLGISMSLIYGLYTSERKYMIPWLGLKLFESCMLTILTCIFFFDLFVEDEVTDAFIIFTFFGSFSGFFWYFFLCVWSLYMDMGEATTTIVPIGESMPAPESIPMTEQMKPPMYQSPTEPFKSPPQEMV